MIAGKLIVFAIDRQLAYWITAGTVIGSCVYYFTMSRSIRAGNSEQAERMAKAEAAYQAHTDAMEARWAEQDAKPESFTNMFIQHIEDFIHIHENPKDDQ